MLGRKVRYYSALFVRYYLFGFPSVLIDLGFRYFFPSSLVMGINVIDTIPETQKESVYLMEEALTLISIYDKRRFKRIQREIHTIGSVATHICVAKYCRPLKVCYIDLRYFFDKDLTYSIKLLGSALIHEATHGSLFTAQILQTTTNHSRVERLCNREAKRFLSHVGIDNSVWDLYEEKDLKQRSLWSRLRLLPKDIREAWNRDSASEADVWKNLTSSSKDSAREHKK